MAQANPSSSTTQSTALNNPSGHAPRTRSTFDLSHKRYTTLPFGMVLPSLVLDTVPGDGFKMQSTHSIRSYTLNSPLMSGVRLNKDNFYVPLRALYRDSYDVLFQHPQTNTGSEYVDEYIYSCLTSTEISLLVNAFNAGIKDLLPRVGDGTSVQIDYGRLFGFYQIAMQLLSKGGLLKRLGINIADFCVYRNVQTEKHISCDDVLDLVGRILACATFKVPYGSGASTVDVSLPNNNPHSLYRYYGMMPAFFISSDIKNEGGLYVMLDVNNNEAARTYATQLKELLGLDFEMLYLPGMPSKYSMHRLFAYQAVAHHFYTNDKIDAICNNNEYCQRMLSLGHGVMYKSGYESITVKTFLCNGVRYPVPYCSNKVIAFACSGATSHNPTMSTSAFFAYLLNMFLPAFALRNSDYFTGSRLRPIAMGDSSADVVSSEVSAIEMTRAIQAQRFLNMVNRSGRRISKYFQDLFGVSAGADIECNPQMLSHNECRVDSYEVENTADNQGAITTNIRTSGGDFEYDFDIKEFGVVLSLVSFTAETVYGSFVDRITQQISLPDFYNPFMQFLGDQNVQNYELGPLPSSFQGIINSSPVYGYQSRDMQYKQHVNISDSGFNYNLPSYALIRRTDNEELADVLPFTQSSLSIRHYPDEFDQFFNSLAYTTMAGYFHFIMRFDFKVTASRPMAYDAQILQ